MNVAPIKKVSGTRPAGETWVWFTSLGLAIGLLMVFGLLALIIKNGVGVFWPHEIRVMELKASAMRAAEKTNIVAGIIADVREKHFAKEANSTNQRIAQVEWHVLLGNRDVYGASFRYVNTQDIVAVMLLTATMGATVRIVADGPDEDVAIREIATLFQDGLGERR